MQVSAGVLRRAPDMETAYQAVDAASEMVNLASEKLSQRDYPGAFDHSRDAMRIAASALMFRDGLIAQTLEATTEYIGKRYPDRFRLNDWRWVERTVTGHGPGLLNMVIRAMGKEAGENEAKKAVDIATEFINAVKELVYI